MVKLEERELARTTVNARGQNNDDKNTATPRKLNEENTQNDAR